MNTLYLTLTTTARSWDTLSPQFQYELSRWAAGTPEALEQVQSRTQYSPLSATIDTIVLRDPAWDLPVVYHTVAETIPPEGLTYYQCTESDMLRRVWQGMAEYQQLVTFNGFQYVWPFLYHRSAVHGVVPTIAPPRRPQLVAGGHSRWVDVGELCTFGGAWKRRPTLFQYAEAYRVPYGQPTNSVHRGVAEVAVIQHLHERWHTPVPFTGQ